MLSRGFTLTLFGLLLAGLAVTAGGYGYANFKLRRRLDEQRRQNGEAARLREENQRTQARLTQFATDRTGATQALRADVVRLRQEMAALEKRAIERGAARAGQTAADAVALEGNRDPTQGLVRAELAANVGRATPGDAFQTFIWAALKGGDEAMAASVAVSGRTREKAEALLAELPAEARAKYPTPEKLTALFFANAILTELHAFQVLDHTLTDATHAKLRVRMAGEHKEANVPLELGSDGWRMVVGEKQVDLIRAQLTGVQPNPPRP